MENSYSKVQSESKTMTFLYWMVTDVYGALTLVVLSGMLLVLAVVVFAMMRTYSKPIRNYDTAVTQVKQKIIAVITEILPTKNEVNQHLQVVETIIDNELDALAQNLPAINVTAGDSRQALLTMVKQHLKERVRNASQPQGNNPPKLRSTDGEATKAVILQRVGAMNPAAEVPAQPDKVFNWISTTVWRRVLLGMLIFFSFVFCWTLIVMSGSYNDSRVKQLSAKLMVATNAYIENYDIAQTTKEDAEFKKSLAKTLKTDTEIQSEQRTRLLKESDMLEVKSRRASLRAREAARIVNEITTSAEIFIPNEAIQQQTEKWLNRAEAIHVPKR